MGSDVGDSILVQFSWQPPSEGWYKINWAVHMSLVSRKWWSCLLVLDYEGQVMTYGC